MTTDKYRDKTKQLMLSIANRCHFEHQLCDRDSFPRQFTKDQLQMIELKFEDLSYATYTLEKELKEMKKKVVDNNEMAKTIINMMKEEGLIING